MFRIVSGGTSSYGHASTSTNHDDGDDRMRSTTIEDALIDDDEMDYDGDGTGPSRARTVGGGKVTGPGEVIADAGRWMRSVARRSEGSPGRPGGCGTDCWVCVCSTRGHGTYVQDDKVLASVAGTLERVNKLVSVRPLRTKYRPEVGDLVIGRIAEVGPRRWKVEANAAQNAVLMLASINLPGGVQRRKLESDELQMRTFFQEGDLLVAEVQAFFADGAMSLHTRSLKYGKLKNGMLVIVAPSLIVRLKSHFHSLPHGVDLIIGLNGYIWISKTLPRNPKHQNDQSENAGFGEESAHTVYSSENDDISGRIRRAITRTAIVIVLMAKYCIPLSADIILEAYKAAEEIAGDDETGLRKLKMPQTEELVLRALAETEEA
ncbi:BZ3500_MvSof-1268-A1-R1_Chr2-3g05269 [Microbotryum saponariae]|uniref:BZ3500_MvSof-1268-A1-R1_Chr2-3g05269 protein n=1 Tax=Microbotryum saponariae TaxID=289078 RepID=A0A2X0LX66_9BASI|nr:BZ3500_MvSof-1268-A1-R1_Chr2-3g05269 [Microbotryum saponariae]SDA01095.1 BZ3501_MvSof-1269-A2-R1_Chr2-2g04942 [Microbotryum saponariae]